MNMKIKVKNLVAAFMLLAPFQSFAQPNFSDMLKQLSDTHWKGTYNATARVFLGDAGTAVNCKGPLRVRFFPENQTDLPGELPTVSYRHDADTSKSLNPLCQTIGKRLSVVDVGRCDDFPMKINIEDGKEVEVPFRTLVPRDGGNSAVVSSPSCKRGSVVRDELQLKRLEPSADGKGLTVQIILNSGNIQADLRYELVPCEPGDRCL